MKTTDTRFVWLLWLHAMAADLIHLTKRTYWKNTGASQNLQEAGELACKVQGLATKP